MNKKIEFFYFSPADYQTMEARLNKLASEGWELCSLGPLFTATFRPAAGEVHYLVDFAGNTDDELEWYDFYGWQYVGRMNKINILKTHGPYRRENEEKYNAIQRTEARRRTAKSVLTVAILLVFFGFLFFTELGYQTLLTSVSTVLCLLLPAGALYGVFKVAEWVRLLAKKQLPYPIAVAKAVYNMLFFALLLGGTFYASMQDFQASTNALLFFPAAAALVAVLEVFRRDMPESWKRSMLRLDVVLVVIMLLSSTMLDRSHNFEHNPDYNMFATIEIADDAPLVTISDLMEADGCEVLEYTHGSSLLVAPYYTYEEFAGKDTVLYLRYFKCRYPFAARLVYDGLCAEYGAVPQDGMTTYEDGVVMQKGNTVVVLETTIDCEPRQALEKLF